MSKAKTQSEVCAIGSAGDKPWHRDSKRGSDARALVAAIGAFDGLHQGHQILFAKLREIAQQKQLPAAVICFAPVPRQFFNQPGHFDLLRPGQRLAQLSQEVEMVWMLRFNARMAAMSAADFVEQILIAQLQVKVLLVGSDFCFGRGRLGNVELLVNYRDQFELVVIDQQHDPSGLRYSASAVRKALRNMDVKQAWQLLGRPYAFQGRVQHGQKLGRTLGFPTANFDFPAQHPLRGIFAVWVSGANDSGSVSGSVSGPDSGQILERHPAVASLGTRPAVQGVDLWLEVHLLDFSGDLYGRKLQIEFVAYLRAEQNFSSLDALVEQIHLDVEQARQAFAALSLGAIEPSKLR